MRWAPPPAEVDASQVEWVRKHAISFQLKDDAEDFADLQPLKAVIGNSRIVQLGEQSHGDGTCFEAKIRLIQFLHQEMGFDVLAFESGFYDCHRANQAFRADVSPLEAAQQGVFGIWTGCRQVAPLWDYVSSSTETDQPLDLAGFDCQFTGRASREHLAEDLTAIARKYGIPEPSRSDDVGREFLKQLQHLVEHQKFSGPKQGWLAALDGIIESLDKSTAVEQDAPELRMWRQQLRSLRAYADYTISEASGESATFDTSLLNARDAQMAENLIWLAEQYYPGRRIIVWAASFHILRNAAEIEVPDQSVNYSTIIPMGHHVHQRFGDDVFSIGFTAAEGRAGAWFRPPFEIDVPPSGTLEDMCVRAKLQNAILPLRNTSVEADWLSKKTFARPLGYSWMQASWGRHFDAIIFQKTMDSAKAIQ